MQFGMPDGLTSWISTATTAFKRDVAFELKERHRGVAADSYCAGARATLFFGCTDGNGVNFTGILFFQDI